MKKFTLLLALIMIALMASTQNKKDLQLKIQQAQAKFSRINQKTELLSKLTKIQSLNQETLIKSATTKQKLDSTVSQTLNQETHLWQYDYKDEYIYDSELKNTSYLEKEWNLNSNTWQPSSKSDIGYDNLNRINLMLTYEMDTLINILVQNGKFLVYYNSEGLLDSLILYSTEDAAVTWVLSMKLINQYNASKQLIKTDFSGVDDEGNSMGMNAVYSYTASGKIKTSTTSIAFEGMEFLTSKSEYFYDNSDRLTSIENSTFNPLTLALEKSSRTTYQYNDSGNVTVEIYSNWNGTSWVENSKTDYEYNSAKDVTVETYSNWNGTTWIGESKDEYVYGTTNFSDVVYPSFGFIEATFFPFLGLSGAGESADFSPVKIINGINSSGMMNGNWTNTDKQVFYYSAGTSTNIDEATNTLFSAYPNPATNTVSFRWKGNYERLTLEMYQITGVKVMEQIAYPGKVVSISRLENGIYLFKLLNGQQTLHTGKLIKN